MSLHPAHQLFRFCRKQNRNVLCEVFLVHYSKVLHHYTFRVKLLELIVIIYLYNLEHSLTHLVNLLFSWEISNCKWKHAQMIAQCSNSLQSTNYQLVRGNKRYSCYYWEMLVNKKTNCSVHDCKLLCHNFIKQHLISIFPIIFGPLYNSTEKEEQRKCNKSKLCFCPCVPCPSPSLRLLSFIVRSFHSRGYNFRLGKCIL